jgi:hypothetical protein
LHQIAVAQQEKEDAEREKAEAQQRETEAKQREAQERQQKQDAQKRELEARHKIIELAKFLKQMGLPSDQISEKTGLTEQEIENLKI